MKNYTEDNSINKPKKTASNKFYAVLFITAIIIMLEVALNFCNFIGIYIILVMQLILIVVAIVYVCKGAKHKIISILLIIFSIILSYSPIIKTLTNSTTQNYQYVIHGTGEVDGYKYLNSQESFLKYVNAGYTLIEVDFLYTSDNEIVCSHKFEHLGSYNLKNRPTLEEFLNTKLENQYTGMTLTWLLEQLKTYSDVKIVFDSKEDDTITLLEEITQIANELDIDISSRFIIQVYSIEDYYKIKNNSNLNFESYWFTNYKAHYNYFQINNYFSNLDDVEVIVLSNKDWWAYQFSFVTINKPIAVHNITSSTEASILINNSVSYLYVVSI